ncbi:unnamed protein product, partial [Adineta steineri]
TIFSTPDYVGEFDNAGALMRVDQNLMCSFMVLPSKTKKIEKQDDLNLKLSHATQVSTNNISNLFLIRMDICHKYVKWADIDDVIPSNEPTLYALYKEL